eukprot:TRINITY_DN563_c0_g1_i8.p1 TRINITY_DN563_c0_g1~~TRINITY_DN563_c0_g1_i8.p1  ORF type:complete len:357 (+),score=152.42 TRINITY_DN563_c0_g1_i8:21-1091(+)
MCVRVALQCAWEIGRMDNGKKYVLYCRERKMKAMWLQMLQSVIQKLSRVTGFFNKDVAFRLNAEATVADTNHQLKLIDIQNRVDGIKNLVDPNRKFLREGSVLDSSMAERYIFLFNDLLLVTKKKSGKRFAFVCQIPTHTSITADVPDHDPFLNCIEMVEMEKGKKFFFMYESAAVKKLWLDDFGVAAQSEDSTSVLEVIRDRNTIFVASSSSSSPSESRPESVVGEKGLPKGAISRRDTKRVLKHMKSDILLVPTTTEELKPEELEERKKKRKWDHDSCTTRCTECHDAFTTLNRRHHCRNCGKIFCGPCSTKRAFVKKFGFKKKVRVCGRCFLNPDRATQAQPEDDGSDSDSDD